MYFCLKQVKNGRKLLYSKVAICFKVTVYSKAVLPKRGLLCNIGISNSGIPAQYLIPRSRNLFIILTIGLFVHRTYVYFDFSRHFQVVHNGMSQFFSFSPEQGITTQYPSPIQLKYFNDDNALPVQYRYLSDYYADRYICFIKVKSRKSFMMWP